MGANCRGVGWDFYGADGEPVLDPYGNPKAAKAPANAAAARKQKARPSASATRRAGMSRKIVGRAASQGPVSVSLAGITTPAGRDDRDRPAHHHRRSSPARRARHARAGARAVG